MGTYDTCGGSPVSPNEPDFAPTKLVESVLALLEVSGAPTAVSDKVIALIEAAEASLASSPSQPEEHVAFEWKELAPRGGKIVTRVGYSKDIPTWVPTSEIRALVYAAAPALGEGER